ncbi:MAG: peroxiredoxin [Pseudomonadota bacterium]
MNRIIRSLALALPLALASLAPPASATLERGVAAPRFSTTAALAGRTFAIDLAAKLREGPVVLYFFPRAFTQGCTLEANAFAQAMPDFTAAGATVLGMSGDDIATLQRFSREECRDAFPVGRATPEIVSGYDVAMVQSGMTSRTSYVIAPSGRVVMVHSDMDWRQHVAMTLAAVRALDN